VNEPDSVVARVKRRAFVIAGVSILVAFLLGPRRGASLTICAAVVIFSLLALEKLLGRLVPGSTKPGFRTLVPLLLVTVASFALLGIVLWRWEGFDPVAGAIGLSVVVLAIIPELWSRR
jgi:hypothetical protein